MSPDTVQIYKDEPRAGTFLIAKGFKRPHKKILELIKKYEVRFIRLDNKALSKGLIIEKVSTKKAGRPIVEIMLNEKQTLFLGTLFRNTTIVLDFKEKLANDFVAQSNKLRRLANYKQDPKYLEVRNSSIETRKKATDIMKGFVAYAESQGSKNASRYYGNFTKMTNGLLFIVEGKFKNLRDVMSTPQLMTTASAEAIIEKSIMEEMQKGVYYKEIYQTVKKKVRIFAELHGQSEVMDKQLKLCE